MVKYRQDLIDEVKNSMMMFPEDIILTSANREEIHEIKSDYPFCLRNIMTRLGDMQVVT